MKRLAIVEDATGLVVQEWRGGDEQSIAATAGYTQVALAEDVPSVAGWTWTGGTTFKAPPPSRTIAPIDFARRFTLAEEAAIDALSESDRIVKAWMRRLTLATSVDLDHADIVNGLAYLKSVGIPSVWADTATADRRIVEIRA